MNIYLDADVLFKKRLIVFLLWLEDCGGPKLFTSETAWDEAIRNRKKRYTNFSTRDQSTYNHILNYLNSNGRIIQRQDYINSKITCGNTDAKDVHNVKAAFEIRNIDSIITFNIKDYDISHISTTLNMNTEECDHFLTTYNSTNNPIINCAINKLIAIYKNPKVTRDDVIKFLDSCGCKKLAQSLQ